MLPLKVSNLSLTMPDGDALCESLSFETALGAELNLMEPSVNGNSSILSRITGSPEHPMLDKPFSRFDVELRVTIRELTWESTAQLPTLLVTHDKDDVPLHAKTLSLWDQQAAQYNNLTAEPKHA